MWVSPVFPYPVLRGHNLPFVSYGALNGGLNVVRSHVCLPAVASRPKMAGFGRVACMQGAQGYVAIPGLMGAHGPVKEVRARQSGPSHLCASAFLLADTSISAPYGPQTQDGRLWSGVWHFGSLEGHFDTRSYGGTTYG